MTAGVKHIAVAVLKYFTIIVFVAGVIVKVTIWVQDDLRIKNNQSGKIDTLINQIQPMKKDIATIKDQMVTKEEFFKVDEMNEKKFDYLVRHVQPLNGFSPERLQLGVDSINMMLLKELRYWDLKKNSIPGRIPSASR